MQNDTNLTRLWDSRLRDNVRNTFEALTEADVANINGDSANFLHVLQERYGYTPDEAQTALEKFMRRYNSSDDSHASALTAEQPDNTVREVF